MFVDSFIGFLKVERNSSPQTVRAYENDIGSFRDFLARTDESLSFLDADSDLVRAWVAQMMDGGAAPSTVSRKMSSLRAFYKYLCSEGYAVSNPLQRLQGPKCRRRLPAFVKEHEMDALLAENGSAESYGALRDRMILLCFYSAGLRLSELVGLDVGSVDFGSMAIKVFGKRSRERLVPFGEEMRAALEAYIGSRNSFASSSSGALFLSSRGVRISRSSVYRLVNSSLAGFTSLEKRSPHVLRHSFATAMLNNEAELGAVKELLGHRRLATTEIYTHLTFEELKRFYNKAHPRAGNN